jgi:hypothetical protein
METATKNALWIVSLVSEKGQMSFSFISSLLSKLEKYYPQLVPFWGSVFGIPFLWLSLGLFSKWLPKLINNDQKEVEKPETPEEKFKKKAVPSCGIMEILMTSPQSNGKHINKNSLVSKYPIQRYSVNDLMADINEKEERILQLKELLASDEHFIQKLANQKEIHSIYLKSLEEEKIRIKAEERLAAMQEKIEKLKKEESEFSSLKSALVDDIQQLNHIIQFIHDLEVEKSGENLDAKLEQLKFEMEETIAEGRRRAIGELKATNSQLIKQREDDRIQKDKLLEQMAKLKNYSYESKYNNFSNTYQSINIEDTMEKDCERSAYGFTMPPVYIKLDNSVVSSPYKRNRTKHWGFFGYGDDEDEDQDGDDASEGFYSCDSSTASPSDSFEDDASF